MLCMLCVAGQWLAFLADQMQANPKLVLVLQSWLVTDAGPSLSCHCLHACELDA